MEPIEWLLLAVGLAVGGVFGAKGKRIVKTAAKGCMAAGEKAQEWSTHLRENVRGTVEEAKFEREQESAEA
jgi:esterase/lipase